MSTCGWDAFHAQVTEIVFQHPVVTDNRYCVWFAQGEATRAQVRDFLQQFSVFSNLFLVAQLLKTINAPSLTQARQSCEILVNELGVVFNNGRTTPNAQHELSEDDKDRQGDPELVSTEGTVDGGIYRFTARHFEWLLRVGQALDLRFEDLGRRRCGREATLRFCDALIRLYGSEDPDIAEGASFALEHWAAAGFWKQLTAGLERFKRRECPELRLAFFTWHDRVEDQHAAHTLAELQSAFTRPGFNQKTFLQGAREVLDSAKAFWEGLEAKRKELAAAGSPPLCHATEVMRNPWGLTPALYAGWGQKLQEVADQIPSEAKTPLGGHYPKEESLNL